MKRILVPLDDSEFSRTILPYVKDLFAPSRCEIILFRAARAPEVSLPPGYTVTSQRMPRVLGSEFMPAMYGSPTAAAAQPEHVRREWEDFEETIKRELIPDMDELKGAGYPVKVAVHFGDDPAQEIVNVVEHEEVDVVAMATHGRTGLGRLLRGSVAEKVLHHLSIPILLLRATEEAGAASSRATSSKPSRAKGKNIRDWEEIERNWPQYRASAKATWSKLSESELDVIAGKREKLITRIHEAYGMSREDAEKEVHNWQLSLDPYEVASKSAP